MGRVPMFIGAKFCNIDQENLTEAGGIFGSGGERGVSCDEQEKIMHAEILFLGCTRSLLARFAPSPSGCVGSLRPYLPVGPLIPFSVTIEIVPQDAEERVRTVYHDRTKRVCGGDQ